MNKQVRQRADRQKDIQIAGQQADGERKSKGRELTLAFTSLLALVVDGGALGWQHDRALVVVHRQGLHHCLRADLCNHNTLH